MAGSSSYIRLQCACAACQQVIYIVTLLLLVPLANCSCKQSYYSHAAIKAFGGVKVSLGCCSPNHACFVMTTTFYLRHFGLMQPMYNRLCCYAFLFVHACMHFIYISCLAYICTGLLLSCFPAYLGNQNTSLPASNTTVESKYSMCLLCHYIYDCTYLLFVTC